MRASAYKNMLAELQRMGVPPDAKRLMTDLIRRYAVEDGFKVVERADRKAMALHLHRQGIERAVICQRLMDLYGVSYTTAYRDIGEALKTVPNSGDFWDRGNV